MRAGRHTSVTQTRRSEAEHEDGGERGELGAAAGVVGEAAGRERPHGVRA